MVLMTLPTLDFIFHPQLHCIHRRYYTVARRYEFYFRVAKQYYFYERAQRVSKILSLQQENKIHIFAPPCNVLFIIIIDKKTSIK